VVLRLAIGVIFIAHGTMKWSMWGMEPSEHMSSAMLTIFKILSIAEPLGAVAIMLGFLTRVAAIGLSIIMIGAINSKINVMNIGFMARQGTGWEFDFLILSSVICLLFLGAGKISVDKILSKE
jgi:putative oxidoreductase